MNMHSVLIRRVLAAGLCAGVLLSSGCAFFCRLVCPPDIRPPGMYRVVDLGAVTPNGRSEAFSINNSGEVVGWSLVGNGQKQATLWTNITAPQPTYTPLWMTTGHNSIAYGINASQQKSGWAGGGLAAALPMIFPNTPLEQPANIEGRAYAIEDAGYAVGWSYKTVGSSNQKAVIFNGGRPIAPGGVIATAFELGNFGTDNSRAYGADTVNGQLHIVGGAATASGPTHAFRHVGISRLQPGDDLGTLGGLNSEACSINSSDQVTGWSNLKICAGPPVQHVFLWERGQIRDLGTPWPNLPTTVTDETGRQRTVWWVSSRNRSVDGDGGRCITDRRNVNGQPLIVGYCELFYTLTPTAPMPYDPHCITGGIETLSFQRAFLYDGTMHDLNTLIPQNSGWILTHAWGINDLGQIVGQGWFNGQLRAFALLPSP